MIANPRCHLSANMRRALNRISASSDLQDANAMAFREHDKLRECFPSIASDVSVTINEFTMRKWDRRPSAVY